MSENKELKLNELMNSFDDSLFTVSGPTTMALTTLHNVRPGEAEFVRDALAQIETTQSSQRFSTAHLMHCALLGNGAQLLFTAVLDAPGKRSLPEVLLDHNKVLDSIWRRCEGYPAQGIEDSAGMAEFLAAGCERNQLIVIGYPDATVKEVNRALDWMRKTMHFQIELAKSPKIRS